MLLASTREVELALERARELRGDLDRLVAARLGHLGFDQRGEVPEQPQVGFDLRANAGAADLQHDLRAVLQPGAMHLRDRGRAVRARLEVDEDLERRSPERARQFRQQLLERHRRDVAVQLLEFRDPLGREQVDARREHLARA